MSESAVMFSAITLSSISSRNIVAESPGFSASMMICIRPPDHNHLARSIIRERARGSISRRTRRRSRRIEVSARLMSRAQQPPNVRSRR